MTPDPALRHAPRPALCAAAALCALVGMSLPGLARGEETLAERRARVEALSSAEKQELLEHQKRFAKLEPAEQERLRRLSREVDEDPQAAELRRIMQRYYDWLKTLPPYQRAQLADLPPEARVKRVQQLMAEPARKGGRPAAWAELARREWRAGGFPDRHWRSPRRLDPADIAGLFAWMDVYAKRHGKQLLEKLPGPQRDRLLQSLATEKDDLRRNEMLGWIWLWWQLDNRGEAPAVSEKELADLRSRLSPATGERLKSRPPADQWRAISAMLTTFMLQQYSARHTGAPLPLVTDEELAQFFERELTDKQRDELLKMSGEEMQRQLWRMYVVWKLRQMQFPPGRRSRPGTPPQSKEQAKSGPSSAPDAPVETRQHAKKRWPSDKAKSPTSGGRKAVVKN